jgi:hypothetical protein
MSIGQLYTPASISSHPVLWFRLLANPSLNLGGTWMHLIDMRAPPCLMQGVINSGLLLLVCPLHHRT